MSFQQYQRIKAKSQWNVIIKGKLYLTNLVAFYDAVTAASWQGKTN